MNYKLGHSSFYILSLLYPNIRFAEVYFHQDHLHPNAGFNQQNFEKLALSYTEQQEWLILKDAIPNLQLLEGTRNTSKNDTFLIDWVNGSNAKSAQKAPDLVKYCQDNYINQGGYFGVTMPSISVKPCH